jgi:hypothetical protein
MRTAGTERQRTGAMAHDGVHEEVQLSQDACERVVDTTYLRDPFICPVMGSSGSAFGQ